VKNSRGGVTYKSDASQWPLIFADAALTSQNSTTPQTVKDNCPLQWRSPSNDLLQYAFDISFRAALDAGSADANTKQTFTAVWKGKELWFFTRYTFLGITAGIMALGSAAAMSLLFGWNQLKRFVTLSPLETGKVFGAPILLTASPEHEADSIVREIGRERVAHDGNELIWNGTVYATGLAPSMTRRMVAMNDQGGLIPADDISPSPSYRGHRRGMSSVSSGPKSPPFTPSFGTHAFRTILISP
jgi:hypothetical protein